MAKQPTSLLDFDPAGLIHYLSELGQPGYRARQVLASIYHRLTFDPAEFGGLPRDLRARLAEGLPVLPVSLLQEQVAADGQTRKWLFRLPDGKTVETVLMEYKRRGSKPRRTVCVSTQVGCAIGCLFCATGRAGLTRNLSAGEIVGQVLWVARYLADRDPPEAVTNVVFMGQGEPLQNQAATFGAIDRLNDPDLFGLGARHMTVSTSGLVPGIRALADLPFQVNLAVSLHAPNDELRTRLVPINVRYPIAEVLDASRYYIERTHRRVTFEYVLIEGVNDDAKLGRDLGKLLQGLLCHVNLIPINPIGDDDLRRPSRERTVAFAQAVAAQGIPTTIRIEKGVEIAAACGQLRTEEGRRGNWTGQTGPIEAHRAPAVTPAEALVRARQDVPDRGGRTIRIEAGPKSPSRRSTVRGADRPTTAPARSRGPAAGSARRPAPPGGRGQSSTAGPGRSPRSPTQRPAAGPPPGGAGRPLARRTDGRGPAVPPGRARRSGPGSTGRSPALPSGRRGRRA